MCQALHIVIYLFGIMEILQQFWDVGIVIPTLQKRK